MFYLSDDENEFRTEAGAIFFDYSKAFVLWIVGYAMSGGGMTMDANGHLLALYGIGMGTAFFGFALRLYSEYWQRQKHLRVQLNKEKSKLTIVK